MQTEESNWDKLADAAKQYGQQKKSNMAKLPWYMKVTQDPGEARIKIVFSRWYILWLKAKVTYHIARSAVNKVKDFIKS